MLWPVSVFTTTTWYPKESGLTATVTLVVWLTFTTAGSAVREVTCGISSAEAVVGRIKQQTAKAPTALASNRGPMRIAIPPADYSGQDRLIKMSIDSQRRR